MKYMFLIYGDESIPLTPGMIAPIRARHLAVLREARERGILISAAPLKSTRSATTVRKQSGEGIVTDGPFAESKEQLLGYYILELPSLEEAVEWARRIPAGAEGLEGAVEIRPLSALPEAD